MTKLKRGNGDGDGSYGWLPDGGGIYKLPWQPNACCYFSFIFIFIFILLNATGDPHSGG